MKLSQQDSFLRDNQNKGSQPYVLTIITHNPQYLDQFLIVLCKTFTSGMCNYDLESTHRAGHFDIWFVQIR